MLHLRVVFDVLVTAAATAGEDGAGGLNAGGRRLDDVGELGLNVARMLLEGLPRDRFAGNDEGHHDDFGASAS